MGTAGSGIILVGITVIISVNPRPMTDQFARFKLPSMWGEVLETLPASKIEPEIVYPDDIVFGECDLLPVYRRSRRTRDVHGRMQFRQKFNNGLGGPLALSMRLHGLPRGPDFYYRLEIHKYGDVSLGCQDVGPIQSTTKYTGKLVDFLVDPYGNASLELPDLAATLVGHNSILGRSVIVRPVFKNNDYPINGQVGKNPVGCCVVVHSRNPTPFPPHEIDQSQALLHVEPYNLPGIKESTFSVAGISSKPHSAKDAYNFNIVASSGTRDTNLMHGLNFNPPTMDSANNVQFDRSNALLTNQMNTLLDGKGGQLSVKDRIAEKPINPGSEIIFAVSDIIKDNSSIAKLNQMSDLNQAANIILNEEIQNDVTDAVQDVVDSVSDEILDTTGEVLDNLRDTVLDNSENTKIDDALQLSDMVNDISESVEEITEPIEDNIDDLSIEVGKAEDITIGDSSEEIIDAVEETTELVKGIADETSMEEVLDPFDDTITDLSKEIIEDSFGNKDNIDESIENISDFVEDNHDTMMDDSLADAMDNLGKKTTDAVDNISENIKSLADDMLDSSEVIDSDEIVGDIDDQIDDVNDKLSDSIDQVKDEFEIDDLGLNGDEDSIDNVLSESSTEILDDIFVPKDGNDDRLEDTSDFVDDTLDNIHDGDDDGESEVVDSISDMHDGADSIIEDSEKIDGLMETIEDPGDGIDHDDLAFDNSREILDDATENIGDVLTDSLGLEDETVQEGLSERSSDIVGDINENIDIENIFDDDNADAIENVRDIGEEMLGDTLDKAIDVAGDISDKLHELPNEMLDSLKDSSENIGGDKIDATSDTIENVIENAVDIIDDKISLEGSLTDDFHGKDIIGDAIENKIETAVETVEDVTEKVVEAHSDISNMEVIDKAVDGMSDTLETVVDKVEEVVSDVNDVVSDMNEIPTVIDTLSANVIQDTPAPSNANPLESLIPTPVEVAAEFPPAVPESSGATQQNMETFQSNGNEDEQ